MSPCPPTEVVSAFHDGELSPEREAIVREHLAACAGCRAELTVYRRVSAAFDDAPALRLSATARGRIFDALSTPAWVRLVLPVARPFAAAAAVLLAVGIPVLISRDAGAGTTVTTVNVPAAWETTVVTGTAYSGETPASASNAQFADWVVADLSAGRRR